jgi:hypothetical protein
MVHNASSMLIKNQKGTADLLTSYYLKYRGTAKPQIRFPYPLLFSFIVHVTFSLRKFCHAGRKTSWNYSLHYTPTHISEQPPSRPKMLLFVVSASLIERSFVNAWAMKKKGALNIFAIVYISFVPLKSGKQHVSLVPNG